MALAYILRKSATSLASLSNRLVRIERKPQYPLIFNASNQYFLSHKQSTGPYSRTLQFSTAVKKQSSDDLLLRVIDSEIKCAAESDDYDRVEEIPGGFPFTMEDKPGLQTVTLTREYQGELIKVEVHMLNLITGEVNADMDDDDDGENEKATQSNLPLVVTVSKKGVPSLEFTCTSYPEKIVIDSLAVRHPENSLEEQMAYEGPEFNDLDENLQKAFHKYLEIRGIKGSATSFLHEYMINKDSREYFQWLNNLKKFIAA